MICFQNTAKDYTVIFADAMFFVHFWLGLVGKKKKDILSAVEMLNSPPIRQADGALWNQLVYGGKWRSPCSYMPKFLPEAWYKLQDDVD